MKNNKGRAHLLWSHCGNINTALCRRQIDLHRPEFVRRLTTGSELDANEILSAKMDEKGTIERVLEEGTTEEEWLNSKMACHQIQWPTNTALCCRQIDLHRPEFVRRLTTGLWSMLP